MGRIHRLPADLSNQIAAGEVVERPASVVKELVENAIDAGAQRVTVAVELGGKKLIRVEDDGTGMAADDAQLALERHATSKISTADDLENIRTLGFRGEALPSIASVSHLTLCTRPREEDAGTEIKVNGGVVASVKDVGMPVGTRVEVGDLFYNLPARRKFLKSDVAETTQVSRMVTLLALSHPEVGFTFSSGPRVLLRCPPTLGLADRFYQIYGDRPDLVALRKEAGGIAITGWVAALAEQGPTRGAQQFFINGRIVKDRTIAHAVVDAYAQATSKERSPEVHLFFEMTPDAVDVNVHPTKAEVRFRQQSLVHEVVRRAVQEAIGSGIAPELTLSAPPSSDRLPQLVSIPGLSPGVPFTSRWSPADTLEGGRARARSDQAGSPAGGAARGASPGPEGMGPVGVGEAAAGLVPGADGASTPRTGDIPLKPLMPLGQFRNTFILAVDDDGVAVIDQHVAHERVLYERAMNRLQEGRLESQRLLTPMLLELAPDAQQAILSHREELERFGFDVEEFGEGCIRVTALPAILRHEESAAALRDLGRDLDGLDRGSRAEDALRRIAATTACHAAVKANDPLTYEKMVHILEELRLTAYSTVCPHGRPVMLRLSRREIEKNFQRI
jgi:DNA mismatch repair protein MutL